MTKAFKFIIFDWDGTVMDSTAQITTAMEKAIASMGLPARSLEERRNIIGLGLYEAMFRLFPDEDRDTLVGLTDQYRQHYLSPAVPDGLPFPNTEEVLQSLLDAGHTLAVATGKSRKGLDRGFGMTGLGKYFAASRCADETTSKPDPHMLEELFWETGFTPEESLMIGDSEYDVGMAKAAKVYGLGVETGVHPAQHLRNHGASDVIPSIQELPEWLQSA